MAHALQDGVVHLRRRVFPQRKRGLADLRGVGRLDIDWLLI